MLEESIIVEVEPESIKPRPIDVKLSSPDSSNNSEHSDVMVKDTIVNPVIHEQVHQKNVKKSSAWEEKTTIGSDKRDSLHVRRHSASLLFGPNKKLVVPSRYRGGSIGSCHDMCKYGHRHTSEVKPKSHLKRTPMSINASEGKGLNKIVPKKSVVRRLSFPAVKSGNTHQMHAGEVKLSGKEMVEPKEKQSFSPGGNGEKLLESCSRDFREINVIRDEEKPLRSKPPVKKAASMNSRVHRAPRSSSHLKNHEGKGKFPEDVPEKTLYMIEPNETPQNASPHRKRLLKTQSGSNIGTRKDSKATECGRYNTPLPKSLFPSSNMPSMLKNQKMDDTELVNKHTDYSVYGHHKSKSSTQEATSYIPKLKKGAAKAIQTGKSNPNLIKAFLPAIDKPSKSEEDLAGKESVLSKHGGTISRDGKVKPSTPTARSKPGTTKVKQQDVEPKAKAITKGAKSKIAEGEGSGSVWKLKFRRGKVVSLPSGNNNPVKLKFRRPRSFSDNRHVETAGKATYKSKEAEDVYKDGEEPAAKVVLRRREANYKKDDVDLNNVIEETASKLVKTRKSKVKALVGAFETVMSLRDRKATNNDTS